MKDPQAVFAALMRSAPFQPATNLWRAVELDAVQRHGLPQGRGLDLGCGDGKLTIIVRDLLDAQTRNGIRWTGVDIDAAETAMARASGMYARVHTGSAAAIDEPAGSFDFVFSNSVLEHIGPIHDVLAEAARLLRPGGRFIATVPGPDFHDCLAGPWLQRTTREAYLQEVDRRCAHLRYWRKAQWQDELAAVGLDLSTARPYLSQRQARRWEVLSAWTGGLAYRLYGRTPRPIEIQRRLGLRADRSGWLGSLGAAAAPLLSARCPLSADDSGPRFACLLLDAAKR